MSTDRIPNEGRVPQQEASGRAFAGSFNAVDVCAGYAKKKVIENVNLEVRRGEIVTLIGPNGSGKSTLLKTMTGWLDTQGGSSLIEGKEMKDLKGADIGKKMALLLTEKIRPELMTCCDVVVTGRYPYTGRFGILSEQDRQIAADAMRMVRIFELADRDFEQTSDGQKQRVMLARAICQDAPYLLLDEPTTFLDIKYKLERMEILRKLAKKGTGILMSLHELDLAGMVSDKLVCVRSRHSAEEEAAGVQSWIDRIGSPEEIFSGNYLDELYGMAPGTYRRFAAESRIFKD